MRITKTLGVVLAGAVLGAAGFAGALFGGGEKPALTGRVAVLDMSRVLSEHKGLAARQEELQKMARQSQAKLDKLRGELDQLNGELMVYAKGSKEYLAKKHDIDMKKLAFEQKGQDLQFELDQKKTEVLKEAISDIEEKVGKYCLEHGIDVVYSAPFSVNKVKTNDPADILKWLSEADVVWANDALDITGVVITIVNGS